MNGGADIRPVEYLADLYLTSGRNIARVTAPGRMLSFYGGHAIVRDLRDVFWALQQADVTIQPTARYWEFIPAWIRQLKDPDQGGREAYEVAAAIVLPEGWHVGRPPDYALYHDRDALPTPYGWAPEPPPAPSSPKAHCACCAKPLPAAQLKQGFTCCSPQCTAEMAQRGGAPQFPPQPCAWCGEPFTPVLWRPKPGADRQLTRYCSQACAAQGGRQHPGETRLERLRRQSPADPKPCPQCGGLFKPYRSGKGYTKYCSQRCNIQANIIPNRAHPAPAAAP